MMTASMYQVDWVTAACRLFLRDNLREDTCCAIFDQLVGVTNRGLQGLYAQFIHDNIATISDKKSFLELSADAIQHLAMYRTTFDFCVGLARWLDHDADLRQEIAGSLLIDLDFFSLDVDELEDLAGLNAIKCLDTIQRDLKHVIRVQTASGNVGKGSFFSYSSSLEKWQDWRVPRAGWYHFVAMGAKAADASSYQGGQGVIVGASIELQAGQVVKILTGSMSRVGNGRSGVFSGGGGGTFVVGPNGSLLVAAGGGGGCSQYGFSGIDANVETNGSASPKGNAGGSQGSNAPTGGLGWLAGLDRLAAPLGTNNSSGFGGGGVYGGGGGYSGGGEFQNYGGGGGGGSYVCCEAINVWKRVGSKGDGRVSIWNCKEKPTAKAFENWLVA